MRKQAACIQFLVEDVVLRHFGDAGQAAESSPDANVTFVIKAMFNRDVPNGSQRAAFHWAVEDAVYKCVV